jgi:hydrogenase expression/formation protein HypC
MCLAIPGKVLSISGEAPFDLKGRVSFGGLIKEVSLACVPDVLPGEYVIVHVGFALSKLDEEEARRVFAYLEKNEDLEELNAGEETP